MISAMNTDQMFRSAVNVTPGSDVTRGLNRGDGFRDHGTHNAAAARCNPDHIFNSNAAETTVWDEFVKSDKCGPPAFLAPQVHERRYKIYPGLHRHHEIFFETSAQP